MERYGKRQAQRDFGRLCEALGKRQATSYSDKGAWYLDYAACYGGYVVHELLEGGGVREPFGSERVSAREFCGRVRFLLRGLEHHNALWERAIDMLEAQREAALARREAVQEAAAALRDVGRTSMDTTKGTAAPLPCTSDEDSANVVDFAEHKRRRSDFTRWV